MPIKSTSSQATKAEHEPSKSLVASYVGASILGVALGVLLVMLYFAMTVLALIIGIYVFLVLPFSLLSGHYVSFGEFLFG